jgi:hypothetical protein
MSPEPPGGPPEPSEGLHAVSTPGAPPEGQSESQKRQDDQLGGSYFTLPADLVAQLDAKAAEEYREGSERTARAAEVHWAPALGHYRRSAANSGFAGERSWGPAGPPPPIPRPPRYDVERLRSWHDDYRRSCGDGWGYVECSYAYGWLERYAMSPEALASALLRIDRCPECPGGEWCLRERGEQS